MDEIAATASQGPRRGLVLAHVPCEPRTCPLSPGHHPSTASSFRASESCAFAGVHTRTGPSHIKLTFRWCCWQMGHLGECHMHALCRASLGRTCYKRKQALAFSGTTLHQEERTNEPPRSQAQQITYSQTTAGGDIRNVDKTARC